MPLLKKTLCFIKEETKRQKIPVRPPIGSLNFDLKLRTAHLDTPTKAIARRDELRESSIFKGRLNRTRGARPSEYLAFTPRRNGGSAKMRPTADLRTADRRISV